MATQSRHRTGFFESSTSTAFKKTKFQHKWSMHDFSDYCDLKETKIVSSIFSDGTEDGLKWRLEINMIKSYNNNYLNIDLFLVSNNFDELEVHCQLSILNSKLTPTQTVKRKIQFTKTNLKENFSNFISKQELLNPKNQYLRYNKLTILCEIVILGSYQNTSSQFAMPDDLGLLLFENPDYTVVTFSVSGKKLYALKKILVTHSPVFAAMFNHDTKEKEMNLIEIKDVNYEIMEIMLRFFYTNKISIFERIAADLLFAADKYELQHLKRRCEVSMIEHLTIDNAAKYYVLADRHNVEELKSQVQVFIMANAQKVQSSCNFEPYYSQNSWLFRDVGLQR